MFKSHNECANLIHNYYCLYFIKSNRPESLMWHYIGFVSVLIGDFQQLS